MVLLHKDVGLYFHEEGYYSQNNAEQQSNIYTKLHHIHSHAKTDFNKNTNRTTKNQLFQGGKK